jgi:hypothetical protein
VDHVRDMRLRAPQNLSDLLDRQNVRRVLHISPLTCKVTVEASRDKWGAFFSEWFLSYGKFILRICV